jgi:hypothetical protein
MHEKSVVIESRAKRNPMRLVREHRCDGQRNVLRCRAGAQLPQRPWSEDPTCDAVEKPSRDEPGHQVGRRLLRHLQALAHLCSCYPSTLLRSEIVKQVENVLAHGAPEYIFGVYLGMTFADYSG